MYMNSQAIICTNKADFHVDKPVLQQTGDRYIKQTIANLTLKVKPLKKYACGLGLGHYCGCKCFQNTRLSTWSTQCMISADLLI